MKLGKKRLLIGASAISGFGAAAMLVAGTTFGLFSSNATQSPGNTFTAGTVSIGNPVTTQCTLTDAATAGAMEPGDSTAGWNSQSSTPVEMGSGTDASCTFSVQYSGTLGAFIGLAAVPNPASSGLYTATAETDSNGATAGLQLLVTDNSGNSYSDIGVLNDGGGTSSNPLFVADNAKDTPTTYTFTVDYLLPLATANALQGASTTLTLSVYAVQDSNNGTGGCIVGSQCTSTQVKSWS